MKEIKIFITIVLFFSAFCLENYIITNGTEMHITSLKSEEIYDFYINASYYEIAYISLEMNDMSTIPFSSIGIYEYTNISLNYIYNNSRIITFSKKIVN